MLPKGYMKKPYQQAQYKKEHNNISNHQNNKQFEIISNCESTIVRSTIAA